MQDAASVDITPREKPDGGFVPIKVWLLAAAYWSYHTKRLKPRALRVFLALHEMQARRCTLEPRRRPHYGLTELRGLVGGVGGAHLRRDLEALKKLGLVRCGGGGGEESDFTWPKSVKDLELPLGEFQAWFASHFENRARTVPLPRRVLRFLAGAGTKALIGAVLGHAIRMLYMRKRLIDPRGRCKVSWVAHAFGLNTSSVERARARMLELGLIVRDGNGSAKELWARRRWGGCFHWNLAWEGELHSEAKPPEVSTGTHHPTKDDQQQRQQEPPSPSVGNGKRETGIAGSRSTGLRGVSDFSTTSLRGVESNRYPLRGSRNQKPTSGRPAAGVSKRGRARKNTLPKTPTLRDIQRDDLESTDRLLVLLEDAKARGLLGESEADRLRFVSLAEHARRYGTRNPPGLFRSLLERGRFHFITQDDEELAGRRLKEHLLGEGYAREDAPKNAQRAAPGREAPVLSDDARFVRMVTRTLRQRGVPGDVFEHVSRHRPEWTRERWDAAWRELNLPRQPEAAETAKSVGELLGLVRGGASC